MEAVIVQLGLIKSKVDRVVKLWRDCINDG